MILVMGASGTVGTEVVKQLLFAKRGVRAAARHPEKLETLKALGEFQTAAADLSKPETLAPLFKDIDAAFLLSPASPEMVEQESAFIKAAQAGGVKKLVYLSAFGADPESLLSLGKWHGEVEAALKRTALEWTILQPLMFMQNMLFQAPSIKKDGAFRIPVGENRVGMIDARDIAAVAVKALTEPGHQKQTYVLTGPQSVTFHEVAAALSTATNKKITYVPISDQEAKKGLQAAGLPQAFIDALLEFYGVLATGAGDQTTDAVAKVGKGKPRTIAQFAKDYAKHFN